MGLTAACKKETKSTIIPSGSVVQEGEERFEPYIDTFMDRLRVAGLDPDTSLLEVKFAENMESNILGSCTKIEGYYQVVLINRSRWKQLSVGSREELIFHELGHCVLNRRHNTATVNNIPVSIMNPYHLGPGTYASEVFYGNYQTELFSTSPEVFAGYLFDPGFYGASHYSHDNSMLLKPTEEDRHPFCESDGSSMISTK